jgi:uncharacterized protein Smg (DUF494 family)
MKQTLMKIVDVILRRMEEVPETAQSESGIRLWLRQQGYNKRDIEDALRLLRPRMASPRNAAPPDAPPTARPLSGEEMFKLRPESRAALARLETYGLIDPYEREMILDRLNHFESEIGLDELDYLVSWVVCSTRDVETQQTIYNALEGNAEFYH